jgi:hypothetical protein
MQSNVPEVEHWKKNGLIVAPPATPFFSCSGFQHHIYKVALHEYWPMSSGDALISSWPTLVWRGHRPQEGGGCVRA